MHPKRLRKDLVIVEVELVVTHIVSGASERFRGPVMHRLSMGRDSSSPINFQGPSISRKHFDLICTDRCLVVQDLSTNGTWVNGKRAARGSQHRIHDGDLIEIPEYRIEIRLPDQMSQRVSPAPDAASADKARGQSSWLRRASFDPLEGLVLLGAVCSLGVILVYIW
jgi:pSer/pThr/pTyr-binding forkhead associated (FHA) protein